VRQKLLSWLKLPIAQSRGPTSSTQQVRDVKGRVTGLSLGFVDFLEDTEGYVALQAGWGWKGETGHVPVA